MYHYTYRITNIVENKYYYGVHSSICLPKEDIGFNYWSSSKQEFINDQKNNSQNYKYKVIKTFTTRLDADNHEIFLHKKFDVRTHKLFYNGMNAGTPNFTVTKENHWVNNKSKEEIESIYKKVSEKNKINVKIQLERNGHWTKNKSEDDVEKIYKKSGIKQKETKSSNEFKEKLKNSEKFQKSKLNRNQNGELNNNSKSFEIYDNFGRLISSGKGNYKEECSKIGISFTSFNKYKNNENGMYSDIISKRSLSLLIKNGSIKFKNFKIKWDIKG